MARGAGATKPEECSIASAAGGARRPAWRDDAPVRIGVSSCLLGRAVRWDGGHKRDVFLTEQLASFVEWVPVCPEVEIGMGAPREPIRLVAGRGRAGIRLLAEHSGTDWSEPMRAWARRRVRALEALELHGFVLKSGSPSCGRERVRVWNATGRAERRGRGLFAEALLAAAPALPVEEEGRLADPAAREHWLERVFAYRRLRTLFAGRWTRGELAEFHAAHALQLRAHSPRHAAALDRLVAGASRLGPAALRERYVAGFLEALRQRATPRRHAHVLERVLAQLGVRLHGRDRRALASLVADYERGRVPLIAPIARIRRHVDRLGLADLAGQVYLDPQRKELLLRSAV